MPVVNNSPLLFCDTVCNEEELCPSLPKLPIFFSRRLLQQELLARLLNEKAINNHKNTTDLSIDPKLDTCCPNTIERKLVATYPKKIFVEGMFSLNQNFSY